MNPNQEIEKFKQLKKEVADTFLTENSASNAEISEWKGQDITLFQEDLLAKVKGRVSEKWFYTYMKSDNKKLPRIDMLNLLSEYAGYENWANFSGNLKTEKSEIIYQPPEHEKKAKKFFTQYWKVNLALLGIFMVAIFVIFGFNRQKEVSFCFIDSDRNMAIEYPLQIELIYENESSKFFKTNEKGCVNFETNEKQIKFNVHSPYYTSNTIVRNLKPGNNQENILLDTDDYALMLYFLSNSKVEDWKKRRAEWNEMLSDDVLIYQVFQVENQGVDVLSKNEFINLMTLPTEKLRKFDLLEKKVVDGKIVQLKFKIKSV